MNGTKVFGWVTGLALVAVSGLALASHITPAKAKVIKTDMVTAYNVCSGAPDATLFFGGAPLPGCTPKLATATTLTHLVTFGPKGSLNVAVSLGAGDIKLAIKGADILDNGAPMNGDLTIVANSAVSTTDNCGAGFPAAAPDGTSCTSQDLGSLFSAFFTTPCVAGKCSLKSSINTFIPGAISGGTRANTAIGAIGMKDPDGDLAFVSGLLIP